jgi:hypothetical protein
MCMPATAFLTGSPNLSIFQHAPEQTAAKPTTTWFGHEPKFGAVSLDVGSSGSAA